MSSPVGDDEKELKTLETRRHLYLVGLLVGASGTTALLVAFNGLVSVVPYLARAILLLFIVALALLRDLVPGAEGVIRGNSRQIPREVLEDSSMGVLQFGAEMGTGMRTYLTSAAVVPVIGFCLLMASTWWVIALCGAAFATGRYVPVHISRYRPEGLVDGPLWRFVSNYSARAGTVSTAAIVLLLTVQH